MRHFCYTAKRLQRPVAELELYGRQLDAMQMCLLSARNADLQHYLHICVDCGRPVLGVYEARTLRDRAHVDAMQVLDRFFVGDGYSVRVSDDCRQNGGTQAMFLSPTVIPEGCSKLKELFTKILTY